MRTTLYMTYSTDNEPYLGYARRLGDQINALKAGQFHHLRAMRHGNGMDFFADVQGILYHALTEWIDANPVIFLDCDLELRKPILDLFDGDWDIAAVYRGHRCLENHSGRQDFSSAFVAMNCKRPNLIRGFWLKWINKMMSWPVLYPEKVPKSIVEQGWLASWFSDQSSLNDILLPDGPERRVLGFEVYKAGKYRILPLRPEDYTAEWPMRIKDPYVYHYKPPKGRRNVIR